MKKILLIIILLSCIKQLVFAQTYSRFVVSDLIVKKLNVGIEQRYKVVGLEAIIDFSKPEFSGDKLFDSNAGVRYNYGAAVKFYLDPKNTKKRQHFLALLAKNAIQKQNFENNLYKRTNQSVGLFYGFKKALHQNLFYEVNFGFAQNFNFRYFDLTRDYEIVVTPNYNFNPSFSPNPFAGLGDFGRPSSYTSGNLVLNFSLTYQL